MPKTDLNASLRDKSRSSHKLKFWTPERAADNLARCGCALVQA